MLQPVWRKGNPPTLLVGMQMDITTMEERMEGSLKNKIELPYDPTIPYLGIYPEKTTVQNDTCTQVFLEYYLQ